MKPLHYLLIAMLVSCSPAAKLKRAKKLIAQAEASGLTWSVDTIYKEIAVPIESVRLDTLFKDVPGDTVTLIKDRLKVVYVRLPGDSVFIEGECEADTVYQKVATVVNREIEVKSGLPWWIWVVIGVMGLVIVRLIFK